MHLLICSTDIANLEKHRRVDWNYRDDLIRKAENNNKMVEYKQPIVQGSVDQLAKILDSTKVVIFCGKFFNFVSHPCFVAMWYLEWYGHTSIRILVWPV